MIEVPLTLAVAARINVTDTATGRTVPVDVEEARRALEAAQGSADRWAEVAAFLADHGLPNLAENQLVDFNNAVAAVAACLDEERKKKIDACVCSLTSSLASPRTS